MLLATGSRLGPYEILAPIGAGGMGEVYRARDAKLGRDVALKVLPEAFARDAERMARFQREAKVLASLNHPNIASIYGLEDSGTTHALVMELVEGPTLADRIRSGPISIDEALRIAKQMCEAIEYAHDRGIVHRDLKPANVKVTSDDAVKILDFGLAKALEGDASSIDIATSPTISRMATQAGVLLGTAAYMSPEQAKGKAVDRRADIWGFGCVLYEMLTGKMAFRGESVTDTLAAVIKEDPDWSLLPPATPIRVRVLLQRCLQKDPKQRLQAIGDARISLDEVLLGAPDPALAGAAGISAPLWRRALPWAIAALLFVTLAPIAFIHFREKPPSAQAMRFEIPMPDKTNFGGALSVSPDGRKLAFIATDADGITHLLVRSLDSLQARPLDGTEGATGFPFWSPDSAYIVYGVGGKLMKIEGSGGPPQTLCDSPLVFSGVWRKDGKIDFFSSAEVLEVSAAGGPTSPVTNGGGFSSLLPDGKHVVFSWGAPGAPDSGTYVASLDGAGGERVRKKLLADESAVAYVPSLGTSTGYLLFVRGDSVAAGMGTLMAAPFDPGKLDLVGDPVPIAEQVSSASISTSETGVLVYWGGTGAGAGQSRGNIQGQLAWFDREGKVLGTMGEVGVYRSLALSPDGRQVAFERDDPQTRNRDIWLYDFARGVTTRFTFDPGSDSNPQWSPDGSHIAFTSDPSGTFDLYQKASNLAGNDELVFKSSDGKVPSDWSHDGRYLVYYNNTLPDHVWALPMNGGAADRKPIQLTQSKFAEVAGRLSPNSRWIAYTSNESGTAEVYVRPFEPGTAGGSSSAAGAPVTGQWMVSKGGGGTPLWRGDGKELFYIGLNETAMAVDVETSGVFRAGIPKPLFKLPAGVVFWDVTSDGKRFILPLPSAANAANPANPLTVVLNWQAELKK